MSRFAVIIIELPLDGGDIEDAKILAESVRHRGISDEPFDISSGAFKPYGHIVDVLIEDRRPGAMGKSRAVALLREIDVSELGDKGDGEAS